MSPTSRRKFAQTVVAGGALLPFLTSDLLAQKTATAPVSPKPTDATPAKPDAQSIALAKALTEVVRAQSGQFLDDSELARIGNDFAESAPYLEQFRSYRLTNADEPDFTFAVLVKR